MDRGRAISKLQRLVGRRAELAALVAAVDDVASGGGSGWVSVTGEPGIGKSRLLRELSLEAERRGCLVLRGSAAEIERDVPYAVLVDALDAYVGTLGGQLTPAAAA